MPRSVGYPRVVWLHFLQIFHADVVCTPPHEIGALLCVFLYKAGTRDDGQRTFAT